MTIKISNNPKTKTKAKRVQGYTFAEEPIAFYVSEQTASYGKTPPFFVYYDNPEKSIKLLKGDCIEILNQARENSVDMIFADPPYFLSNGGITCHAGKMVSVNKGKWDKSRGVEENHKFILEWLKACQRVLKPNGTIWVSGTTHIIYSVGFAMQELGYKILNDIVWYKRNAPKIPRKSFPDFKEIFIWAAKNQKSKHYFDYQLMKFFNNGKQMRNLWQFEEEKEISKGNIAKRLKTLASVLDKKHSMQSVTQRPRKLLERIILASTKEGDLIADFSCGSSKIGILAVQHNRKYIGILSGSRPKEFYC